MVNTLKNSSNNPVLTTENKVSNTKDSIKRKIDNLTFFDKRSKALSDYFFKKRFLNDKKGYFRNKQQHAIKSLIKNLNNGGNGGLIKLPTGTGKTFLFGNIIKALNSPSIILVPRENLVDGTYDELVGNDKKPGLGFDKTQVHKIYGRGIGSVTKQTQNLLNSGDFNGTLIITYQSFVSLIKKDKSLFEQLIKNIGTIISDEAHRSLGKQTKKALGDAKYLINNDDEENDEESEIIDIPEEGEDFKAEELAEKKIDELIKNKSNLVHIHTTATPILSKKQIEENIIYQANFEDVVNDGDLILPKQPEIGNAILTIKGEKISLSDNNSPLDKFSFEDGTLVYEDLTLHYIDQKEKNGGYMPTVAFCNTTDQVEFYVKYLLSLGIKAIQCTTNTSGTNYKNIIEAENMLEWGQADIIVTCSKVGEGWDLPTLRGTIWLCPSSSPARVMQGIGRIARTLSDEDTQRISKKTGIDEKYIKKSSNNTFVFSPSKWSYKMYLEKEDIDEEDIDDNNNINNKNKKNEKQERENEYLGESYTGIELFVIHGEISVETARLMGLDIDFNDLKIKTLKEYIEYFHENIKEFEAFGIEFEEKKGVINVNLNNIVSSQKFDLFGQKASSGLRNLYKALGNQDEGKVDNKIKSKEILKHFFKEIKGYEVILDEKKLKNVKLEYYKSYFETHKQEFEDFGVVFGTRYEDGKEIFTVNLNNTGNPSKFYLFGLKAISGLKNLYKVLGNNDEGLINNITKAKEVLKLFFEELEGYEVILDEKKLKNCKLDKLEDYKSYFETHKQEFEDFGIVFGIKHGNGKKILISDLNNIGSPENFYFLENTIFSSKNS